MKRRKDGRLIPADSNILIINGQEIPKEIKVGFLIRNTKMYIPNPQRCFNCQNYGHNKRFCKNEQKCAKYRQPGHEDHECENETKCANYDGDNPAYRICPKWKTEKEILKIKYQNNISFHEARQQVEEPATDPSKSSYASVAKPHQWTKSIFYKQFQIWRRLAKAIPLILYWNDLTTLKIKSLFKIMYLAPVLPLNYLCSPKLFLNEKLNQQFRILALLHHWLLNLKHLQLPMMKMKWKTLAQAQNEVISSDEEPNSPVSIKPASSSPASGRDGISVPTGTGRGDPSKISTFCPNPPRPGGQGSSGGIGLPYGLLIIKNTRLK